MQIPEYVRAQIESIVARAQAQYRSRTEQHQLEGTLNSARGQTDYLRSKFMSGLQDALDPELEAHLQQLLELADDPSTNEYLKQIQAMVQELFL